jgi:hypothetical protein
MFCDRMKAVGSPARAGAPCRLERCVERQRLAVVENLAGFADARAGDLKGVRFRTPFSTAALGAALVGSFPLPMTERIPHSLLASLEIAALGGRLFAQPIHLGLYRRASFALALHLLDRGIERHTIGDDLVRECARVREDRAALPQEFGCKTQRLFGFSRFNILTPAAHSRRGINQRQRHRLLALLEVAALKIARGVRN